MTVEKVIAKIYDLGGDSSTRLSKSSDEDFEEKLNEVVLQEAKKKEKAKASDKSSAETKKYSEQNSSTAFAVKQSFSMFVRVTQEFDKLSQGLGEEFNNLTRQVLGGIEKFSNKAEYKVNNYLVGAKKATSYGISSASNFINKMQQMHQNSLQAMLGAQGNQGLLPGFNMSTNSSLAGTSGADIARLYLSSAASGQSASGGIYEISGGGVSALKLKAHNSGLKLISATERSDLSHELVGQQSYSNNIASNYKTNFASEFLDGFMSLFNAFMGEKQGETRKIASAGKVKVSVEVGFDLKRFSLGIASVGT